MHRQILTRMRSSSRAIRWTVFSAIMGLMTSSLPVLAEEVGEFAIRRGSRAVAAVQRTMEPAKVRVNRTVPTITSPSLEVVFGVDVTTERLRRARVFGEALIPTSEPAQDENIALAQLLQGIAARPADHQLNAVDRFLTARPGSPWRASLLANAATLYASEGYFSRAAAYWDEAWMLTRDHTEPAIRAVADFVLGERLQLLVAFGDTQRLESRLSEVATRDVRGTAASKVSGAREGFQQLTQHHEMATFSGPQALRAYLNVVPTTLPEASARAIGAYHPPMTGTSLQDLRALAHSAGLALEMVHMTGVGDVPVPSVIHFRSEHYSAVVGMEHGKYVLQDPVLGGKRLVSAAAIRDEASGYFLVDSLGARDPRWRAVPPDEAASVLGHCAPGAPAGNEPPCPDCGGGGPGPSGTPSYSFHPLTASLLVEDVPLGYAPAVGPAVTLQLSYNQREGRHPQTPAYAHVGSLWTFNWLSYVSDNPYYIFGPYAAAAVTLRGHGRELYHSVPSLHYYSRAQLIKVAHDPPRYERVTSDGTREVFTLADRGASEYGRRIFLTEVIDPQGHTLTLAYDAQFRIVAITDALGQVTTLDYLDGADPLRITKVTDPFGRVATLTYDALGRLESITDVANMTSRFSYGTYDFIASMTTPYGTTTFRHEPNASQTQSFRRIEATDPMGGAERLEFHWQHSQLPATAPSAEVPAGFAAANESLNYYNSIYWDKIAMAQAPGDLSKAVITNWLFGGEVPGEHGWSRIPHSIKRPLENRIWYRYPGQPISGHSAGIGRSPSLTGRVLDDGTSQIAQASYSATGHVTSRMDPAGRQTTYTYAPNGIDLLEVRQVQTGGGTDLLHSYGNYANHLPGTITDAAGQTTAITYNGAGQPLTVTNAKGETTTSTYDAVTGSLLTVTGPVAGATTISGYDGYGRLQTVTEPDGYAVTTAYDALNRVTTRTYPDGTTETNTYSRLDLVAQKDRLGRVTRHFYDGFGRRTATQDAAGRTISQVWCDCGSLESLVDANGNRTTWERDVQGRVTREVRADGTTDTHYTYDLAGRLRTVTDPKDQVATHTYTVDDQAAQTTYTNAVVATPSVSYTYDADYARVATMVDGIGTTSYTYQPAATLGAGQVASIDGPLTDDTITYSYDQLGRVTTRAINGAVNTVTWAFDALGRVTSETNLLGAFTYAYDGVTSRLATVSYPNGQTSVYSYLPTDQDHRLQTILHKYPNGSTLSKFDYTYDAVGNILTWRQQADTTAILWKYGYDAADQLTRAVKHATDGPETVLQRFAYAYDPAGNRTVEQIDDGITLSSYDELNRLTAQAPGGSLQIAGTLNEPGTVTISETAASVNTANAFQGTLPTVAGTNMFTVVARDVSGNQTTQQYEVDVAGTGRTFAYDANGNMLGDGTRGFEWDAKNQLLAINVGVQRSEFSYDGQQRRVRILEESSGTPQSDVGVAWCGSVLCEERLWGTSTIARRVFATAEQVSTGARFLTPDHLGSVREINDVVSTLLARYAFDPWGRRSSEIGADVPDSGYTGHHWQNNGAISLAQFRGYDAYLGRWISEDPAGSVDGPNLYAYTKNNPIKFVDPLGLCSCGDECPSGNWFLSTVVAGGGPPGLGLYKGFGVLRCKGTLVFRTVSVTCAQWGLLYNVGASISLNWRKPRQLGCSRKELKPFTTSGYIVDLGVVSVEEGSIGFGLGVPGGRGLYGQVDCQVTPR